MFVNATKVTLFFLQEGYGWTETWYKTGVPINFATLEPAVLQLAQQRIKLSGSQTQIIALRIQDASKLRVGESYSPNSPMFGSSTHDSDAPDTAILCRRYNDNNTQTSNLFVRGVWDDAVQKGGHIVAGSGWPPAFAAFAAFIASNGWGWLGEDKTLSAAGTISALTVDLNGYWTITTAGPVFDPSFVGTQQAVRLSGIRGATTLNGQWVVHIISTTQAKTVRQILANPWQSPSGRLTFRVVKFIAAATMTPERVVERKAGRPLYHSPGKSKARRVTW